MAFKELEERRVLRLHLHLLLGSAISVPKHTNDGTQLPLQIPFLVQLIRPVGSLRLVTRRVVVTKEVVEWTRHIE